MRRIVAVPDLREVSDMQQHTPIAVASGDHVEIWARTLASPEPKRMPWAASALGTRFVVGLALVIWRAARNVDRPIPVIYRTHTSPVKVIDIYDTSQSESDEANLKVDYIDAEGDVRQSHLADMIDGSWLDYVTPGRTWQISPYPPATTRVC